MTFKFGQRSKDNLLTCHKDLRDIAYEAIIATPVDFMVIQGWRSEAEQNSYYDRGLSKVRFPNSKHNHVVDGAPQSLAIDFVPYIEGRPIDWSDTHMFAVVAGVLMSTAIGQFDLKLRWGGDWDMDGSTKDQTFMDWGHIELIT